MTPPIPLAKKAVVETKLSLPVIAKATPKDRPKHRSRDRHQATKQVAQAEVLPFVSAITAAAKEMEAAARIASEMHARPLAS